jgi:hypothetical protein
MAPAATGPPDRYAVPLWRLGGATYGYTLFYVGCGRLLRGRRPGLRRNWLARAAVPALLVLACALPVLVDAMAYGGVRRWWALHAGNPFWTLAQPTQLEDGVVAAVLGAAALVGLLCLPSGWRGLAEVAHAAAERRQRAAAERRQRAP